VETTGSFQWNTQVCTFGFNSCGDGGGGGSNVPPAPGNLVGIGGRQGTNLFVDLTWTDNSSGDAQETAFVIERAVLSGRPTVCGAFTEIDTVGTDVTAYRDAGLERRTTFCYLVRGRNDEGDGDASNVVTVRPR